MSSNVTAINPCKAWLSELLFVREILKGPTGKPLYSYQITESEYVSLRMLLRHQLGKIANPAENLLFGACFCLFVSEQYRRNYNRSWSWSGAEDELGKTFTAIEHGTLSQKGLDYWLRPVRRRENGHDWLGSLFAEGGLPWPLVKDDSHGFGRAVRRGIKNYFRTEGNRRTTADLMSDSERYLPISFRNLETRQLLAGIVDQLMYLVEHYSLKEQQDPASYLDQAAPYWSKDFPIPLDEANARKLINDWLRDAGEKCQERKEALERARDFTCEHVLLGSLPNWAIRTELILPLSVTFAIDPGQFNSTRFEIAYYEGEHILACAGAVYGQLNDECMQIRFANQQVTLDRRRLLEPVTLRLLDNGRVIHSFYFDGSILDCQETPLIFERYAERWKLAGTSSCKLQGDKTLIRLPPDFKLSAEHEAATYIAKDELCGQWFEVISDVSLQFSNDCYRIELNKAAVDAFKPTLNGTFALFVSNPAIVYLGWPTLDLPKDFGYERDELLEYANGKLLEQVRRTEFYGMVRYALRSKDGKTLLQRRFAVLPNGFSLALSPSMRDQPAKILLKNAEQLGAHVVGDSLGLYKLPEEQGVGLYLRHEGLKPPTNFILELGQLGTGQTVQLHLPFPFKGARILDADNQPTMSRDFMLSELIGKHIVLTSGVSRVERFTIVLELHCVTRPQPQRSYEIKVGSSPALVSLYGFQNDMMQMLGAVDEQDVFIKFKVDTPAGNLLNLNIRRYNGRIKWEGGGHLAICGVSSQKILDGAHVEAMLLSDPKQKPLVFEQRTSQDVSTGIFVVPDTMQHKGPWLIYPAQDSDVQFRPSLFAVFTPNTDIPVEIFSLHSAAELFHPVHNPDVINLQIKAMAEDFDHTGWQYLADLKKNYSHLLLSCFECWKALSRHPRAMAFAVLRLEMNEEFCNRVRDELAVIWEATPLIVWSEVYRYFFRSLQEKGLPQVMISNLEENRASVLRTVVSGFDHVGDYLHTSNCAALTKVQPELILPIWCIQLRQMHEANKCWPSNLGSVLGSWISMQDLPVQLKSLSQEGFGFAKAVIYLPIFMAFVTAEKAKMTDLEVPLPYLKFAIRLVADFDRKNWFNPVHALMVSYLMASQSEA